MLVPVIGWLAMMLGFRRMGLIGRIGPIGTDQAYGMFTEESVMKVMLCVLLMCAGAGAEFRAGVAIRVVTPDPLLSVSGGAGGAEPATKKIGELTVRALALDKDGVRAAIVRRGFLGFPGVFMCPRGARR